MAFIIRVGSLTVVARSAAEALGMVDKIENDEGSAAPVISTFEGATIDVDELRQCFADLDPS